MKWWVIAAHVYMSWGKSRLARCWDARSVRAICKGGQQFLLLADGGEIMLSPSWICSEYPESATVTNSSGNRRNGTGKPHERATQTLVGAPFWGNYEPNEWIGHFWLIVIWLHLLCEIGIVWARRNRTWLTAISCAGLIKYYITHKQESSLYIPC
jgi:hypothetical protein